MAPLSIKPIGQFWTGLGIEVQIPRSQIEFPGEEKENPLIKMHEIGVGFINNAEKSIQFDEIRSKLRLSLRFCEKGENVDPPYPSLSGTEEIERGNFANKIIINDETIKSLNDLQSFMESNYEKVLQKEKKEKIMNNIKKVKTQTLGQNTSLNNIRCP